MKPNARVSEKPRAIHSTRKSARRETRNLLVAGLLLVVLASCQSVNPTPLVSASSSPPSSPNEGAAPAARFDAAGALDPASGNYVLFGGRRDNTLLSDTWLHDGRSWKQLSNPTHPSARFAAAAAEDVAHHDVVLFGGESDSSGALGDTWVWAGQSWTQMHPARSPMPRFGHSMAFDSSRGKVVLVAGQSGPNSILADTWIWDGQNWNQIATADPVTPHAFAAMAFDVSMQLMVLVGVYPDGDASTWTFDGQNWTRHSSTSGNQPLANDAPSAYDASAGKVLMLVAERRSTQAISQLLAWDGGQWSARTSTSVPPARFGAALGYSPKIGGLLLFGGAIATVTANGLDRGEALGDTWLWDGHDWRRLS